MNTMRSLRSFMIISSSGLVVFQKDFTGNGQPSRLVGPLLTVMTEFAIQSVGLPVAYIELEKVAVSIVTSDEYRATCALFHDVDDGPDFGRLIANELVRSFVAEHGKDLEVRHLNLRDFEGFHAKIPGVLRGAVKPILDNLSGHRGVQLAAVASNVRALLDLAAEAMEAVLVVVCRKSIAAASTAAAVASAARLLERLHAVLACLGPR
eukprot:tig00000241_g20878.t1